jgi:predicted ATPase
MAERAQVSSIDALEAFRSNLVIYVSKARPALEEVSAEVVRTRAWLETEKRAYWENQVRRRRKELEAAQEALFSARISNLRKESAAEQLAFHRARRAVDEAEDKLRILKKWTREFDTRVQPLLKQTEKLHTLLSHDMSLALAYLTEALNLLAAYAEIKAPSPIETNPAATAQAEEMSSTPANAPSATPGTPKP